MVRRPETLRLCPELDPQHQEAQQPSSGRPLLETVFGVAISVLDLQGFRSFRFSRQLAHLG